MPVDIGSIKRNDQIAGAAAILAFIFALIPGARTAELKEQFQGQGLEDSDSVNLWHGLGVLAGILLLVGIAALVVVILNRSEFQAYPMRWISTGAWALTSLFTLIFIFTSQAPYDVPSGVDKSEGLDFAAGWVGYLLLLLCLVTTVFAALGAQESGEKLPWQQGQAAGPEATPPPAA